MSEYVCSKRNPAARQHAPSLGFASVPSQVGRSTESPALREIKHPGKNAASQSLITFSNEGRRKFGRSTCVEHSVIILARQSQVTINTTQKDRCHSKMSYKNASPTPEESPESRFNSEINAPQVNSQVNRYVASFAPVSFMFSI